MIQALRIAATGMAAQQMNVDVLSNNIANLNTTGYKQQQAAFEDLLYQNHIGVGAITSSSGTVAPTGAQVGLGVNVGSIYRLMEQGTVNNTGNPLDLAIQGKGFFKIAMPDGTTQYTRDGTFQVDQNGQIVNNQGFALDPSITIPAEATNLTVSASGVISAEVNNVVTELGTITLTNFINSAGLKNEGNNRYSETIASGTPTDSEPGVDGTGELLQGALETSNVDPIESITDLISAQRAFELNSRIISTADEMLGAINQIT